MVHLLPSTEFMIVFLFQMQVCLKTFWCRYIKGLQSETQVKSKWQYIIYHITVPSCKLFTKTLFLKPVLRYHQTYR